jgi:hypothetical protein
MLKRTHQSNGVRHSGAPVVGGTLLALLPILALGYALFLYPPLGFLDTDQNPDDLMAPRIEDKIFWPPIFAVTVFLLLINRSQLNRELIWSPPILGLAAYMTFARASIAWEYSKEYALTR